MPDGGTVALCTVDTAVWKGTRRRDDTRPVTCPWCRVRMLAIEIVDPPGPRAAAPSRTESWSEACVYTMRHSDELRACMAAGGTREWVENKRWVRGRELFDKARAAGDSMPIVFSAAERDSGLIFSGRLTAIELSDDETGGGTTRYSVADLAPIDPSQPLSNLTVMSTGRPLPDDHIRPYAICLTPDFLPGPAPA